MVQKPVNAPIIQPKPLTLPKRPGSGKGETPTHTDPNRPKK